MEKSFQTIRDFLAMLRAHKGPAGSVSLRAYHWAPEAPGASRDIVARKKVILPTITLNSGHFDGDLRVGELLNFSARSTTPGFVHLFDFGTSGSVVKLGPSKDHDDNALRAGEEITIPSEKICPTPDQMNAWRVSGPLSAETGHPERLLVLVTRNDVPVAIEDLHPDLPQFARELYAPSARGGTTKGLGAAPPAPVARGAGFAGKAQVRTPTLFTLAPTDYEYGLLELNVTE